MAHEYINQKKNKKFWCEIKSLLKGNVSTCVNQRLFDIDKGELVVIGAEASFINNFYVNVGKLVHNPNVPQDLYPIDLLPIIDNTLEFDPITIDEVVRLSVDIEIGKSSGIAEFNSNIFKNVIKTLPKDFCKMFNKSIVEGSFPETWAMGTVLPIPKSGSLQRVSNWRPISILPI